MLGKRDERRMKVLSLFDGISCGMLALQGKNIMAELKPCPFCGEKPDDYIKTISGISQVKIVMYIICRKCEIEKSTDIQGGVPFERLIEAHEKLIKDWNTRVGE